MYSAEVDAGWLDQLGRRVIATELAFNRAAGLAAVDDRLPRFFSTEHLPPKGDQFDVTDASIDSIWEDLLDGS